MSKNTKKYPWLVLVVGSMLGLVASLIQTIERIDYAKNPQVYLRCDLSAVFSCRNVFDAWQSSFFGFSNSLMCMIFFGVVLGIGLAGIFSDSISKWPRLIGQYFSLFFLGFGAWYLYQSAYAIGYICIFCSACYLGVIAINWAWLRLNYQDLPYLKKYSSKFSKLMSSGTDTLLWSLYTVVIACMIAFRFWYS